MADTLHVGIVDGLDVRATARELYDTGKRGQAKVLVIIARGADTITKMCEATGMSRSAAWQRVRDLRSAGLIVDVRRNDLEDLLASLDDAEPVGVIEIADRRGEK